MKKKKTNPQNTSRSAIINQIDTDEITGEPIMVLMELPSEDEGDGASAPVSTPPAEKSPYDFMENVKGKQVGKQLFMTKILGFTGNEVNKRQKTFKIIFTVLFVSFVLLVLGFTFYRDFFASGKELPSWGSLLTIFADNWFYILLALSSLFFCYLFKGLKLSIMCKSTTGKFHFSTCFETGIIGHYYNAVTPLAVGGQPFEIYHLSKHGVHGGVASSLPIAAYFLNQFAFVLCTLVSLIMFSANALGIQGNFYDFAAYFPVFSTMAYVGVALCLLLPLAVIIFSLLPRFCARVVKGVISLGAKMRLIKNPKKTTYVTIKNVMHNTRCLKKIAKNPPTLIFSFLVSLGEQVALMSIAYFTLKFFGFKITTVDNFMLEWLQSIQLCIILYSAISFIPTPGNSGAADLSFYLLFEAGLAAGLAFPAMIVWRVLAFYSFIIIGFTFATIKKRSDRKKELSTYRIED